MYVVLVLILLFLLVREKYLERFGIKKCGSFPSQKSGSQKDNQASIFGCPHFFFWSPRTLEFCYPVCYIVNMDKMVLHGNNTKVLI